MIHLYDHDSDIEEITPPSFGPDRVGCPPSLPSLPAVGGLQVHFYDEPRGDSFPFGSPIDYVYLPSTGFHLGLILQWTFPVRPQRLSGHSLHL